MMYASLLFWAAIFFPGYVVARRLLPAELECGGVGIFGLSYFGAFALLAPINLACYLLQTPLWVFSATIVVLTAAGLFEITRRRWWRELAGGFLRDRSLAAIIGAAVLAVDLVFSARAGAGLVGDAIVHLARIRHVLDYGFNNHDPFVAGGFFFPLYHTNLLHALYASCAQLTRIGHVECWFASLPVAKLLIAAGFYYVTWTVFGRRWTAFAVLAFAVAWNAPTDFLMYPNKLAPRWLGAMMLGFVVRLSEDRRTWNMTVVFLAGALIVGQLHSLYGAFFLAALGPVLVLRGLIDLATRRPRAAVPFACAVALLAVLPFGLIARQYIGNGDDGAGDIVHATRHADESFDEADMEWHMMAPRAGFGTIKSWRSWLLLPGIALALASARRRHAGIVLLASGIVATVFFATPLCTAAVGLLGSEWILGRFGFVLNLGFAVLGVGSAVYAVGQLLTRPWMRGAMLIAAFAIGVAYALTASPNVWIAHVARITSPIEVLHGRLEWTAHLRRFCHAHFPPRSTVLADEWRGMVLCALCDVNIVAPRRASNGVPDVEKRRADLSVMLNPATDWPTREALLRHYRIEYLFFPRAHNVNWAWDHVHSNLTDGKFHAYKLDIEP